MRSSARATWSWAAACGLILCAAFAATLPATLTDADAGEFLVVAATGGVVHPPGYPLYVLLLRALWPLSAHWPAVTVAAAASAVMVALAGALLVGAFRRWVSPGAMTCAVLMVALSPPVWREANAAEPFGMTLLLAAGVFFVSAELLAALTTTDATERLEPRHQRRVIWLAALLGVLFGCGAMSHHALVLLLPVPLIVLIRRWSLAFAMLGGALLGCLPALTLLNADVTAPLVYGDWSDGARWSTLVNHLLRRDYGTFSLAGGEFQAYGAAFWWLLRILPRSLLLIGPLLALGGLYAAWRWPRSVALSVVLCVATTGPIFLMRMNLSPVDEPVVVARFFALPVFLLAPLVGGGLGWLATPIAPRLRTAAYGVLAMATVAGQVAASRVLSNRREETVYEAHIRQMLAVAGRPEHAVLVSASDLHDYGLAYGQRVLGLSPQVPIIMAGLGAVPWYTTKLAQQLGVPETAFTAGVVPLLDQLNRVMPLMLADAPLPPRPPFFVRAVPLGGTYVVVPPAADAPVWSDIYAANVELMEAQSVLPATDRTTPLTGWEHRLLVQHRDHLGEVCDALERLERAELADCRRRVAAFTEVLTRLGPSPLSP